MATNFPKHVPQKLHMVTLVRSGIRRPWWEKRILKKLGLTKRLKTVILKNTEEVNDQLRSIKTLIDVKPIVVKGFCNSKNSSEELKQLKADLSSTADKIGDLKLISGPFLNVNGEFDEKEYLNYINNFPEKKLNKVLEKSHYPNAELMNRDYFLEEEAKKTEKCDQISLYFKKTTWKTKTRQVNRNRNTTKY
ncbi:uncharacterized protein LOC130654423 [Hydractinia symbiolongicarpus]|uniref:uncharacterized protein LOC130654423 n=1 Tax=Hydractinia symbiolongicarpus TaxID=13093 RepID=UPI00254EDCA5|nr:uncharacterized protein LOC130654423 [Hydractinia symbiolongicarpus]